jgi:CubicO group peptidase (beta-lactamase class C family)
VRQLLAHTSGFDQAYVADDAPDRVTAVKRILAVKLIDRPGAKFHYANNNYELAAAIVEVATHDDYQRFVRANLFQPAGLKDTGFAGSAGARTVLPARNPPPRLFRRVWGEATVYSTTHDLARWYRALRGGRVLSRGSTAALFTPVTPIHEGQGALGWFIRRPALGGSPIYIRGNEDFGANSLLYAYPDRAVLIVVLTHAGMSTDDLSWSRRILEVLEPAIFEAEAGSRKFDLHRKR